MDDHDKDASIHTFEISMEVANKGFFSRQIINYLNKKRYIEFR